MKTLTKYNPNPYDGEPYYNLGLALKWQGQWSEAYACFYKACWNSAWKGPGYYQLALIDCRAALEGFSDFAGFSDFHDSMHSDHSDMTSTEKDEA